MIRNIIFDMGQVLIEFVPDAMIQRLGVSREDGDLLRTEVFGSVSWVQLDRGTVTEEEAAAAMCRRLPPRLHQAARELVFSWWQRPLTPIPGMSELIGELKSRGYGIYLLSNASIRLHAYFSRIPGSEFFDGLLVSADWKLLKPQPEIYRALLQTFHLQAEECFFIDDLPANVEGARLVGIHGAVFRRNVPKLREDLAEAGIRIGRT